MISDCYVLGMTGHTFKVVVIDEAGSLSNEAQAALRRTMERYMKTCRTLIVRRLVKSKPGPTTNNKNKVHIKTMSCWRPGAMWIVLLV